MRKIFFTLLSFGLICGQLTYAKDNLAPITQKSIDSVNKVRWTISLLDVGKYDLNDFVNTIAQQEKTSLSYKNISANGKLSLAVLNSDLFESNSLKLSVQNYFKHFNIIMNTQTIGLENNLLKFINLRERSYIKNVSYTNGVITMHPSIEYDGLDWETKTFSYNNEKYLNVDLSEFYGINMRNKLKSYNNKILETYNQTQSVNFPLSNLNNTIKDNFNMPIHGTIITSLSPTVIGFFTPEIIK